MGLPLAVQDSSSSASLHARSAPSVTFGRRIDALAARFALHIESLEPRGRPRCLEIGAGEATFADAIRVQIPRTAWRSLDVQPPAHARDDTHWDGQRPFDGTLPCDDGEFDIVLLCDVLHRPEIDAGRLLAEARRVARHVLVKDCFEQHAMPRPMRTLMRSLAASVAWAPNHFTREAFVELANEQRLALTALDCDLDLDEHLPSARRFLDPARQFIAVLRAA